MITEDYCSYEVAKLLKEKGFKESTQFVWYEHLPSPNAVNNSEIGKPKRDYFYWEKDRIRNMFFSKKHDELVVKIKNKQEHLKVLQVELNKINHFAEHGILGDRLLDKQIMLEQAVRATKTDIFLLKWQYQNKGGKNE